MIQKTEKKSRTTEKSILRKDKGKAETKVNERTRTL